MSIVLSWALVAILASDPATAPEPPLLERVAVVGASVSHGLGNGLPLAAAMAHVLPERAHTVVDLTALLQSFDALRFGELQVDRCIEERATLVVGVDFLFWYAAGVRVRGARELDVRRARLLRGLAELDRLACPLVIGDVPDLRDADSRMLPPGMLPTDVVRDALNQEIRRFAAMRPRVLVVPLERWLEEIRAGLWSLPAPTGAAPPRTVRVSEVFLADGVHLTRLGAVLLFERVAGEIRRRHGDAARALAFDLRREVRRLKRRGTRRRQALRSASASASRRSRSGAPCAYCEPVS